MDADIILPASSVKPEYKGKPTLLKWLSGSLRRLHTEENPTPITAAYEQQMKGKKGWALAASLITV